MLNTHDACFAIVDDANAQTQTRDSALRSLRMMHSMQVVDGLVKRLASTQSIEARMGILNALCRLHFNEGKWEGNSWGTRPDYRGPYYQPEAWSETGKIASVLKSTLASAPPEEAAFLVSELNRNRIQFSEALQRILALAKSDAKAIPDLATQLAGADAAVVIGVEALEEVEVHPQALQGGRHGDPVRLGQGDRLLQGLKGVDGDRARRCQRRVRAPAAAAQLLRHGGQQRGAAAAIENHVQRLERLNPRGGGPPTPFHGVRVLNVTMLLYTGVARVVAASMSSSCTLALI
jgi:hypothetical protein